MDIDTGLIPMRMSSAPPDGVIPSVSPLRTRKKGDGGASCSAGAIHHRWDVNIPEARAIQESLAHLVIMQDCLGEVRFVAGMDVGIDIRRSTARASAVVLTFPALQLYDWAVAERPVTFPYIPGLLSFREIPVMLEALEKLKQAPDLVICDGQGLAHPRRLGIACHFGILTGIPTIGAAKSRLIGTHRPLGPRKGQYAFLKDGPNCIGLVLRTRTGVKPIFVSIGHRVGLMTACRFVLACTTRYRLPETTRFAHRLASSGALHGFR